MRSQRWQQLYPASASAFWFPLPAFLWAQTVSPHPVMLEGRTVPSPEVSVVLLVYCVVGSPPGSGGFAIEIEEVVSM